MASAPGSGRWDPWSGYGLAALTPRRYLTHAATGRSGAALPTMSPWTTRPPAPPPNGPTTWTGCWPTRSLLGRSGFAKGSALYERARPGYSEESVAHLLTTLGVGPASRVLDIAAGTGKLTRALVAIGCGRRGQ